MYFKRYLLLLVFCLTGPVWANDAARVVFVAGQATVAGRAAQMGAAVAEGQSLQTGKDGYLYLETIDHGFFILRPNSKGQIVSYFVDAQNPANSRMKLELESGVARHISGQAAKSARQNFRFNTPVAAIGLRGTDFTIYADQNVTRITVLSGGVVVSPLAGACLAEGFGPCEGTASRELFANLNASTTSGLGKATQTLQVERGKSPVVLQGTEQAPDLIAPPRSNEPAAPKLSAASPVQPTALAPLTPTAALTPSQSQSTALTQSSALSQSAASTDKLSKDQNLEAYKTNLVTQSTSSTGGASQLIWGRWQAVLDQKIEVDVAALQAKNQLIAANNYYAVMRNSDSVWLPTSQASIGFALVQSQAVITDEASRVAVPAKLENGQLQVNFVNSSFFTKFDLVSQSQRFQLQNNGEVSPDGKLYGGPQFLRPNNIYVSGALASDNRSAAYLFQSRLDDGRLASGVTLWGK
jgi:hypothetical protein